MHRRIEAFKVGSAALWAATGPRVQRPDSARIYGSPSEVQHSETRKRKWLVRLAGWAMAASCAASAFAQAKDSGAYSQLVEAAQPKPAAVTAVPGGPLTGEMSIRRGPKISEAQKQKHRAQLEKILHKHKKHKKPKPTKKPKNKK
jgi:hypothetical protein